VSEAGVTPGYALRCGRSRRLDWRRRDVLLLGYFLDMIAEFDVRSVQRRRRQRSGGSRDRARVVCEVRRVVDATVFGAVAAVLLLLAEHSARPRAAWRPMARTGGFHEEHDDLVVLDV
jgi:hypothetical protein